MKLLKKQFPGKGEVKGYMFTQVSKTDKAFLYEVSVNSGDAKHYEIFRHKINKRFGQESYPTANAFGIWAWTCMTLDAALEKFNQLNSI